MSNYDIVDKDLNIYCDGGFIGTRYDCQYQSQPIHLYVHNDGDRWVDVQGDIGWCTTSNAFNGLELRIQLGGEVYHEDDIKEFIETNKKLIDELVDSYEEWYDGQRYCGRWDFDLTQELEKACCEFTSKYFFHKED